MSEIWFRGEGLSVIPAKAGGVTNDIGDGMYLTDKIEVANQYAADRATSLDDRRVYSLKLPPGGMRVLDLTKDARWQKHMSSPFPPTDSSGKWTTLDAQLRSHPSSSQYKTHFENFLKANNINLKDFDAIIGHEYRSGGKQMCILYKNGQPSPIQIKLRNLFVPHGALATTKSPAGRLQFGGKIGTGLKIAGGTLVAFAVSILLGWLFGKMKKDDLEKQMEAHRPTIEKDVRLQKQNALNLLVEGKKPFATVHLTVMTTSAYDGGPDGSHTLEETDPVLRYVSAEITDTEINKVEKEEETKYGDLEMKIVYYTASLPLTFTPQEVELYRSYRRETEWFEEQIKTAPSAEDAQRLIKDKNNLNDQLNKALVD